MIWKCSASTSYKTVMKMSEQEDGLDRLGKITLFLCILLEKNEFLARLDYLQWPALFMLIGILLIQLMRKNRVLNDFVFVWLIAFTLCTACSAAWAFNANEVIDDVKFLIKIIVVLGYGLYVTKRENSIEFLVSAMIISTLLSVGMLLPNIMTHGGSQIIRRAQIAIIGVEINANQVCPDIAFATIFLMYRIKTCGRKLCKFAYWGIMGLFVLTILFLGSRASLLLVLCGMLFNALTGSGRSILRHIILALILIVIMLILIMNIPFLYDSIGNRIVDTVNLVLGESYISDNQQSDNLRWQLIKDGWDMFLQQPLLGYGSGNYADIHLTHYGARYYSHNNYIELLASLGIVGTAIFYSFHIKILLDILCNKRVYKNNSIYLAKHIILCMLILDITYVTYNVMDMLFCLLIAYGGYIVGIWPKREGISNEDFICS